MQSEDQYVERTPDLVARVRTLREVVEKEMNRFTRIADYDVRRVVGHGPKPAPVSVETVAPAPISERTKKRVIPSVPAQTSIEFAPTPAERTDTGDDA